MTCLKKVGLLAKQKAGMFCYNLLEIRHAWAIIRHVSFTTTTRKTTFFQFWIMQNRVAGSD